MSTRDYPRLDISTFGRELVRTGDLDPVYIVLHRAGLPERQLQRWLVAYWCFYSVGAASWLSEHEGNDFWEWMALAAHNEVPAPTQDRWPRGHERRHFRGTKSVTAVYSLRGLYGDCPHKMVQYVSGFGRMAGEPAITCSQVVARMREHPQFGPWIGFKAADMIERIGIAEVSFTLEDVLRVESPREAAVRWWEMTYNTKPESPLLALKECARQLMYTEDGLVAQAGCSMRLTAPPRNERLCGLQEVETVLCKWGSHLNGHYPVGNDWEEVYTSLCAWATYSETARRLAAHIPLDVAS